jgi:hypothetical protein
MRKNNAGKIIWKKWMEIALGVVSARIMIYDVQGD